METPKNKSWKVLKSEYLSRQPWFTVRREEVELPNGNKIPEYYIYEYPEWINVIAITKEQKFVFVRQYRHGLGITAYELCAGVCEKEDASPLVSAQRELLEETGYGNGELERTDGNRRQSEHPHQPDLLLSRHRCRTGHGPAP